MGIESNVSERREGNNAYALAQRIFPICRSITGDGVKETISIISEYLGDGVKINMIEVPTGQKVFDWEVPKEWVIREAYIENKKHERVIDFKKNNLHVIGYSAPVDMWVSLDELKEFIYIQNEQPDAIPYVTSYYSEQFGFCMSRNQLEKLDDGYYHMYIDSEYVEGGITIAEVFFPGECKEEVLFTTYDCHPSMANNECSGPCLWAELVKYISNMKDRKLSYRFVMGPETIGAISYLATDNRLQKLKDTVVAGFNLSCVGDNRTYSIVKSRNGNTLADKALLYVLGSSSEVGDNYHVYSFLDRGSDERQYGAPRVDLPFVSFCRSKYNEYPEYHTSLDDLSLVSVEGFQGSFDIMSVLIDLLDNNDYYAGIYPCEPQLGKRGLYPTISKKKTKSRINRVMQDFLAYADGKKDLIDIAKEIYALPREIIDAKNVLFENGLIEIIKENE